MGCNIRAIALKLLDGAAGGAKLFHELPGERGGASDDGHAAGAGSFFNGETDGGLMFLDKGAYYIQVPVGDTPFV